MAEVLQAVNGLLKMLYLMDKEIDAPKPIKMEAESTADITTYKLVAEVFKRLSYGLTATYVVETYPKVK